MFSNRDLDILRTNATDSFDAYMDTFTADSVLHDIYMNIIDSNEEGTRALGYVFALLSAHRDVIRLVWETAQGEWVYATRMASETEFHEDEDGADQ